MRRSNFFVLALFLSTQALGCYLAHGIEDDAAPPPPTPTRPMTTPVPTTPEGHDICPSVPDEDCACGIAERYPHPDDAGRCVLCNPCPESCEVEVPIDETRFADARLTWEAVGGFAGTGSAIVVNGDGQVREWWLTEGFDPESVPDAPPGMTFDVGAGAAAQLFLRLLAADTASLPHDGGWAECYATLFFSECIDCPSITISYNAAEQILPELGCVGQWFDELALTNPTSFCAF